MGKLTSTVTPQGLVGRRAASSTSALEALPGRRVRGGAARGPRPRQRRHGAALGRRGRRRRRRVHRDLGRRLQPEDRPRLGRARCSTCRSSATSTTAAAIDALRARGFRILAMSADGAGDIYDADLSGPVAFVFGNEAHGLPRRGRGPRRRVGPRAARGPSRVAEPRRRRDRVPVRMGAAPAQPGREALETIVAAAAHDIRSPLTAMKGFGYALEKRWDT